MPTWTSESPHQRRSRGRTEPQQHRDPSTRAFALAQDDKRLGAFALAQDGKRLGRSPSLRACPELVEGMTRKKKQPDPRYLQKQSRGLGSPLWVLSEGDTRVSVILSEGKPPNLCHSERGQTPESLSS